MTYDRLTRKDAFYFYKANWNPAPMVYITSRRHVDRTEPATDIKVYSNCPQVTVEVNGQPMAAESQGLGIFVARGVTLAQGDNWIVARGTDAGKGEVATDQCRWTLNVK